MNPRVLSGTSWWWRIAAALILLALNPPARAANGDDTRHYERQFAEAARAYDENRLAEASAGWQALVDEGQALPAVLYNLGNAHYRSGHLGPAIVAYRWAQRLQPRDPDIRANLGFAAQSAGITLPVRAHPVALLLAGSRAEWRGCALVSFWLLFVAGAAWIVWPRWRFLSRPACAALAVALAVAGAGLWAHHDLQVTPECVVMVPDQKILASPLDTATPLVAVPEGAVLRQVSRRGAWVEVRLDPTRGWLPADVLMPVP